MMLRLGTFEDHPIFFKQLWTLALYLLALVALLALGWALYTHNVPMDLRRVFLPAARHVLAGGNPYDVPEFYGPPWALVPALLVAWLPDKAAYAGHGILAILALVTFLAIQKIEPKHAIPALLSAPVMISVLYGNLEPFVILALAVPRQVGLILLAMKPHVGCVLALYWILDEFRGGGLRAVCRVLWPVSVLTALSFALYGFWPVRVFAATQVCGGWEWNVWGAYPWAHVFILGIPATIFALWKEREDMALSAGPILSPYTYVYGFAAWLPWVATWQPWAAWAVCVATWILIQLF